ncbi:MAG: cell division protein FtsL [Methylococcales bacterium]|jgi:cell division protein FtsL|nr:cell division protein FtsL [Methylococcales bacterium]MBT7446100.1 cell division protein FtsL [Methylococcales bacterium]
MGKRLTIMALVVAVLGSAFTVIYTKFLHRKHFVALQSLYQERDSLQIEWQKLRLEHSAWLMQGRVEKVARQQLDFIYPSPKEIVIIKQ